MNQSAQPEANTCYGKHSGEIICCQQISRAPNLRRHGAGAVRCACWIGPPSSAQILTFTPALRLRFAIEGDASINRNLRHANSLPSIRSGCAVNDVRPHSDSLRALRRSSRIEPHRCDAATPVCTSKRWRCSRRSPLLPGPIQRATRSGQERGRSAGRGHA
jgi:hypothetical protein